MLIRRQEEKMQIGSKNRTVGGTLIGGNAYSK